MTFTDICIMTEDVTKTAQFYENVFNTKSEGDSTHSFINAAGLGICIYSKKAAVNDMGFDFTESGTGLISIGFNVDDVDYQYQFIKNLGIASVSEPHLWPWGAKSFRFNDPDGNVIIFRSWSK